jgi:hypothetical protein
MFLFLMGVGLLETIVLLFVVVVLGQIVFLLARMLFRKILDDATEGKIKTLSRVTAFILTPAIVAAAFVLLYFFLSAQDETAQPEDDSAQSNYQIAEEKLRQQTLSVDTFSTSPPEIDGCSCHFSSDSVTYEQGEYIFMDDYDRTAFLKINGVITKFSRIEFNPADSVNGTSLYENERFKLMIESKAGRPVGDEAWVVKGTIRLLSTDGKNASKKFYGVCGC